MPKLFASDIVVIDHTTGKRIPARVEVNKPFTYDGISIYQSSFQDGGSKIEMTAWPMTGDSAKTTPFGGTIGGTAPIDPHIIGAKGETVEFTDFRAINVENVSNGSGADRCARRRPIAFAQASLRRAARLGREDIEAAAICATSARRCNTRCASKDGQAREYNNYMLPVDVAGEPMFLAGMRVSPDDPFRYLRIPADSKAPSRSG